MEEIEGANRVAVESCHRVLNLLDKPQQQDHGNAMNVVSETREAVSKFKRMSTLLRSTVGHARFRRSKTLETHLPESILLDPCHQKTEPPSSQTTPPPSQTTPPSSQTTPPSSQTTPPSSQTTPPPTQKTPPPSQKPPLLWSGLHELSLRPTNSLTLGTPSFSLNTNAKAPLLQLNQLARPSPNYPSLFPKPQKLQQQLQQQLLHGRLLAHHHHQQLQKHQAEIMLRKRNGGISLNFDNSARNPTLSSTRSFVSSLSIDGSVANIEANNSFRLVAIPSLTDQNPQQLKRKCLLIKGNEQGIMKCGSSNRCHCAKKRKIRVRRSIRVPAISSKLSDIPPDDYAWRKYGQKPIKGSPHPRGYYKCSSMRGCPARKHVEKCLQDPSMLVVTYEAEHNHPKMEAQTIAT